jgi:hypothetical protein
MLNWLTPKRPARQQLQSTYARQRAELDAAHAKAGLDVFVSPFEILKDPKGTEFSYSTWPEGVTAWLPCTECIAFTGTNTVGRWFMIVPWLDVERICPEALRAVPGASPERFQTVAWPAPDQLANLGTLALVKKP